MDIRTLALGLGVFCSTFLVGWWFNVGAAFYGTGAPQPQPQPVAAAESSATSGQGQAQAQSGPRFVAHVPVPVNPAQPKTPATKLPQVKYAQEPKAKASSSSSSSPKPGIRVRRR